MYFFKYIILYYIILYIFTSNNLNLATSKCYFVSFFLRQAKINFY